MRFFEWIEQTAVAEYVSVALYAYPIMITLHSLGLAIMVGVSTVLCLRVLGLFSALPLGELTRILKVAWIGLVVNLVSGSLLFSTQAAIYVTDLTFLIKMSFVVLGAVFIAALQSSLETSASINEPAQPSTRNRARAAFCAWGAIASWCIAMVSGRLIAYV